jgi:hypothetical protein
VEEAGENLEAEEEQENLEEAAEEETIFRSQHRRSRPAPSLTAVRSVPVYLFFPDLVERIPIIYCRN